MARTPASASAESPAPPSPMPATYEAAVQELEALVARLESGQMPLDELLGAYQRASALLAYCRSRLEAVEQQIRVVEESGQTRAWEPGA
ncbi:exodeoxyribonuclease VII small subunit [Tepidimonas taiwanensis]|uniref:exodeoxyribonuclease VII small subunit n=1 Tax=Tepidimonas taiwanensis TaxID=307486 RepID=UPI00117EA4F4|nr:exodeoxyribonuclease VII small subunit [Tepidimonas taiwanensis]UBQ06678.1 exodeoxyribonuclease VII small subunit [Tepidimonas taiwanensis]